MAPTPSIVFVVRQLSQAGNWKWNALTHEGKDLVFAGGLCRTKHRALKAIKECLTLLGATAYIAFEIENYKGVGMRYELFAQLAIDAPRFVLGVLPKA